MLQRLAKGLLPRGWRIRDFQQSLAKAPPNATSPEVSSDLTSSFVVLGPLDSPVKEVWDRELQAN